MVCGTSWRPVLSKVRAHDRYKQSNSHFTPPRWAGESHLGAARNSNLKNGGEGSGEVEAGSQPGVDVPGRAQNSFAEMTQLEVLEPEQKPIQRPGGMRPWLA